jgi:hypothetical protein
MRVLSSSNLTFSKRLANLGRAGENMVDPFKLDVLLSDSVIDEIKERIKKHHELYDNKVSSTLWEEILHKSFLKNSLKSNWNMNGHGAGTDVKCEDISISCKSGVIKGKKIKKLSISSYRTTSLKTIQEKVNYLDEKHEDIIFSLVHDEQKYKIFVFIQPKVSDLCWVETKGQWKAVDKDNTWNEFKISKSMSDQFWMNLSMDHWNKWGIKIYDL